MATTYTYNKNCGQNDKYVLTITVTINSQNIANNTTNVTVSMTAKSTDSNYGAYNLSDESPVTLVVNGITVFNARIAIDLRNQKTAKLANWSGNISHDAEGNKTLACSGSFYVAGTGSFGSSYQTTLNTSTRLPQIARASVITSVSNITLGGTTSIIWTPASASFYYKVKLSLGSWSWTSGALHPNKTSAYTYTTPTIPTSVSQQLPNSTSGSMTATLYTYSNSSCSTQIGSASSKTFTVTVPTSIVPSISSTSVADNTNYYATYGAYVQSYSRPVVSITASGNNGSTIKSYTVTLDSKTYNSTSSSITCNAVNSSGTVTIGVSVTDSRNRKASKNITINVLSYSPPSISNFSVYRCNSDGTKNDGGAYLHATCKCLVSPLLKGSTAQNTATLKCFCTPISGGNTLTNSLNVTGSNSAQSQSIIVTSTNTETSYNVYLQLTDRIASVRTSTYNVGTTYVLLHLSDNGDSLAIGKACELSNTFDIALETIIRKAVKIIGNLTVEGEISEI